MYCTNYLFKASVLVVALLINASCSQLQENINSEAATIAAPSNELSVEDLSNYKKALYALKALKFDKAEILLSDIIERHPNLAGPHANMGLVHYKKGHIEQAKQSLKKALTLNPKNPYVYNIMGIIKNNKGDFSSAEKYFLLAIQNKPNYAKAHYNIALLYDIYFHEIKKSIQHYQKYLKIIASKDINDKQTTDWLQQLENSLKQG